MNKSLVLEWPTFIDVYSFSSLLQGYSISRATGFWPLGRVVNLPGWWLVRLVGKI